MKKRIISGLIAAACVISSASAFSWGGMVDNNSKLSANHDFSAIVFNQSNGIYFNVAANLNSDASLRFTGEGLYKYNLNCDFKEKETKFKNIADLDLLKLSGGWTIGAGNLGLSAGRFKYSDFSNSVFTQTSDGLYLSYDTLKFKAGLYGGYTGLLNRLNVFMTENESEDGDQFYALCPKYVPVLADFSYKALFESHTVGLQLAAYFPVTDKNTTKAYGTLIANGYIGTIASYDARVTLGTEKFDGIMLDAVLDANLYLRSDLRLTLGGEYASGAQGSIKPFQTISARSFGGAPFYNGVIVPKLGAMYASGKLFASATERVIISMPENEAKLDGFDTTINLVYNVLSDVQFGLDAGAYICKESKELTNFYATAKAALAF